MVEPVEKLVQSAAYLLKGQDISVARVDVEPGINLKIYQLVSSVNGQELIGELSIYTMKISIK